ncbi:hypothetical protein NC653_020496 [Populus alba x Populus x berolinensis]|uniref:Uncharacterized protein n=1 Tax=Populus alba x Populus x berolinensis TaxID=444605 RepID=A0AAD6ML14_9ROSI|nr:hypothetical protein NC653_020496 [Populus alba x Populus x berolinensis]
MSVIAYVERSIPFATGRLLYFSFLFLWHWVPNITWAAPNESVRTQVLQQAIPNVEELINHRWRHRRISNKAIPLMHKKKAGDDDQDIEAPEIVTKEEGTGGFGKVFFPY